MVFTKYDLYILRNMTSYKAISILLMLAGAAGAMFGISMAIIEGGRSPHIALAGAALVVSGSNFLSYCYISILERISISIDSSAHGEEIVCPKCGSAFKISTLMKQLTIMPPTHFRFPRKESTSIMKKPFMGFLLCFLISFLLFWIMLNYFR